MSQLFMDGTYYQRQRECLLTQEAGEIIAKLKRNGLPFGWHPIRFYECECGHDHDAVILCERTIEDGDHGTRYVVWWVNMDLGGCFNGHYTDDEFEALEMYRQRRRRLR